MNDSVAVVKSIGFALMVCVVFPPNDWAQGQNTIPYKLNSGSTYQTGCFPPCARPLSGEFDVAGTFTLTCARSAAPAAVFHTFAVWDVEWTVSVPGSFDPSIAITGFGSYTSGAFGPAPEESLWMQVDLKIADAPSRRFTGGPDKIAVLKGIFSPDIRVALTRNGKSCQDTVIIVDASPLGACCPEGPDDPMCLVTTEAECETKGGTGRRRTCEKQT